MFIDLILFVFVLAVFYAGVWTGATYGSAKVLARRLLDWAKVKVDGH